MTESANPSSDPAPRPPLRSGWSAPDKQVVIESQRSRLLEAMTELATQKGLEAVTVAELVAHAGVSKPTFYEHFKNKDACFLAVVEAAMVEISTTLLGAFTADTPRSERVSLILGAFLDFVVESEAKARIVLIEAENGDETARQRTRDFQKLVADAFVAQRGLDQQDDPSLPDMSPVRGLAAVGAVVEPVRKALRDGEAATLREDLYDELKVIIDLLLIH